MVVQCNKVELVPKETEKIPPWQPGIAEEHKSLTVVLPRGAAVHGDGACDESAARCQRGFQNLGS